MIAATFRLPSLFFLRKEDDNFLLPCSAYDQTQSHFVSPTSKNAAKPIGVDPSPRLPLVLVEQDDGCI
jgi:hypothetical protein